MPMGVIFRSVFTSLLGRRAHIFHGLTEVLRNAVASRVHEAKRKRGLDVGIVTLTNNKCYRSSAQSRSCRSGHIAPRLHGAGSERPVRVG
jgi:hypothetical protein